MNGDVMMKDFFERESDKYQKEVQNYHALVSQGVPVGSINWRVEAPVKPAYLDRYENASTKYCGYIRKMEELDRKISKHKFGRGPSKQIYLQTVNEKEKLKLEFEEMLFFMGNSL